MVFVLAGGRGSRLKELTDRRVKPAVPFGGKARIIDFALSNAMNSGIRKMAIATQYKAHSLIRHVQRGWNFFGAERNEDSYGVDYVIILAGDHIYKMDYEIMLRQHVEAGADVTVGCLTVPREEATAFGVMATDKDGRITSFLEKPSDPPGTPEDPNMALASMGIYVFDWKYLRKLLQDDDKNPDSTNDFGNDLIPQRLLASAYRFDHLHTRIGPLGSRLADLDIQRSRAARKVHPR